MKFTRIFTLFLFSICLVILPITSEAATFNVNSTIDDVDTVPGNGLCATAGGVCTLRAAIQEANALAGPDTIVLRAKKYYLTIAGADEDSAATGDLDITDYLRIKGVSSAETIVNGGALDRVFQIIGPQTVKFVNLSIQNGFVQGNGGGINNSGGTVSLFYCSVANNLSSGSTGLRGGGIFSSGASLKIKSSSVINNAVISSTGIAYGGGVAVYFGGTLNISESKIAYNSATSVTSEAAGGGILSIEGTGVTITNSKVMSNSATNFSNSGSWGAGITIVDSGVAVISGTNISFNSNTSSGGIAFGGGLYVEDETATISSCTIKGNRVNGMSGGLGGGIAVAFGLSNITINKASTIVSNLASFDGGGIFNDVSTITVSPNSIVVNNMPNDQN